MTRDEARIALLEIVMIHGIGKNMDPMYIVDRIRSYVDERYEIDFADMDEYLDDVETAEWLEAYINEGVE